MATVVKYYNGGALIGEGTVAPNYPLNWNAPVGTKNITAKVFIDGVDATKSGNTITSTVNEVIETGLDVDYQETLNFALANKIPIPDQAQRAIDNQVIIDYKATGAWIKRDTFHKFKGTAHPLFKKICIKRRILAKEYGNGTWSVDGWRGDISSKAFIDPIYDTTGSSLWITNNMGVEWVKTNAEPSVGAITGGNYPGGGFTLLMPRISASESYLALNGNAQLHTSPYGIVGYNSVNRISATQVKQNETTLNKSAGSGFQGKLAIGARIFQETGFIDTFTDNRISYISFGGDISGEYAAIKAVLE